ncbi:MAG: hypothetical protein S4CHLAM102_15850 [Chlamydiia bacterium]|nr:hypothetical protein [Chlamydiia bacterium]
MTFVEWIYRTDAVGSFFLWYFLSINAIYYILLAIGWIQIRKRLKAIKTENYLEVLRSNSLPEFTLLVAAYDEEELILKVLKNLLSLTYKNKKIIVINDGSKDRTLELVNNRYNLKPIPIDYEHVLVTRRVKGFYRSKSNPDLYLIDKENGNKFDAMNAGVNATKSEYYISVDADTYLENETFERLIRPILEKPETIGLGAAIRIIQGAQVEYMRIVPETITHSFTTAMQSIEYLRAFLQKQAWEHAGGNFCLSGAFAVIKTSACIDSGGYMPTVAEDMEMVMKLQRYNREQKNKFAISYIPDPVAWTTVPNTMKELGNQRANWHRGLFDVVFYNRKMFLNPKFGMYGMFVYPFIIFGEGFEPVVEVFAYTYVFVGLYYGLIDTIYLKSILYVGFGLTTVFTAFCILIEELSFKKFTSFRTIVTLLYYSFIENLYYRQLSLWWRINGIWRFIRGV